MVSLHEVVTELSRHPGRNTHAGTSRWVGQTARKPVLTPVSGPTLGRSEVERAAKFIRAIATGKKITRVETVEDTIVYTGGITHEQFVGSFVQGSSFRAHMFSSAER